MRLALPAALCAVLLGAACGDATAPATPPAVDQPPDVLPPTANAAWPEPRRVVFLHRSVGGALVRNGQVDMYGVLAELNAARGTDLELWHHFCGLGPYWNRLYDGTDAWIEPNFGPGVEESPSATPEQWERVFCAPDARYVAARDSLDNYRVILFKSGYDNTVVYASDRAETWRNNYRAMRNSPFFTDQDRRIIVLGFAPNREGLGGCTQADADSARAFNDWLEEWFVGNRKNLFVFPLFDQLAGADNWLRDEYGIVANPNDAHPNVYACGIVGRELMTFIHTVSMQDADPTSVPAPRP